MTDQELYEVLSQSMPDYNIIERIGSGYYDSVYKCERDGIYYAIKIISIPANARELQTLYARSDAEDVQAYLKEKAEGCLKEIMLIAELKGNRSIVNIEDYKVIKSDSGLWYIVIRMEFLTSLTLYASKHELDEDEVIRLGIDICDALSIYEKHNIIHRDIKPENIMRHVDGNFKLGDFGVAKQLSKTTVGSDGFMAPEVYKGQDYNQTADIYALGIVLYYFLNNKKMPYVAPNDKSLIAEQQAIEKRMTDNNPLPLPPKASKSLGQIVVKACMFDKNCRYSSAVDMREDLVKVLNGEIVDETLRINSPAPPPVQASYYMANRTSEPHDRQDKNRKREKAETVAAKSSRKGFLGLFKREKKNNYISTEECILPPPNIDSVQFSAVAPNRVVPGRYLPINIVMYEDAFRKTVDDIIRSHGENVKESKSGYQDVERNSLIKVILTSPDVIIEDGVEEQKWNGKYLDFEFAAKIPNTFDEEQILFSAAVYINDIIATKLKLILECERKSKRNISVTREDIVSAFVSYASQDRNRVASIIQGMKKARPDMDIFFDIESLRSGQKWEDALKSEIASRDILFLCWSRFARDSKWVDMEWRYALENKGEDCIEPIPIDSPDVCPPPIELQQKHFNDKMLYIIKATTTEMPYLIWSKNGERIYITKSVFHIGKDSGSADFVISENKAISRAHADIICEDGNYYIVDTDSTNHTYIDGNVIKSGVEMLLVDGMKLRLANEEFVFKTH